MSLNIHRVSGGVSNIYIVEDDRKLIIVDSGLPGFGGQVVRKIRSLGYAPDSVSAVVLTHAHIDHAGNAAFLRRSTNAPLLMHRGDAEMARKGKHGLPRGRGWLGTTTESLSKTLRLQYHFEPFEPDIWLEDAQSLDDFGIEGRIIYTPGHSAGSITLALRDNILFIGDALINQFKLGYPMYWESGDQCKSSARKIQSLRPRVLYSGHGAAFSGAALDNFLARRELYSNLESRA